MNEGNQRQGLVLVTLAALAWSFGGSIERAIGVENQWTVIFWRSFFATSFLLCFLLWRDGVRGTARLLSEMRWPSIGVALSFTASSTCFVMALAHTSVANVLLIQAGVPLLAALLTWIVFRERIAWATWVAIVMVLVGMGIMVSGSFSGKMSLLGDGLAVVVAVIFACGIVLMRRYAHVRMTPAVALGTFLAGLIAASMAGSFAVSMRDLGFLFAFGALNLGLGLALFVSGARFLPAALAALLSTLEPMLGPIWAWLFHGEAPSVQALQGGGLILLALLLNIGWQLRAGRKPTIQTVNASL